MYIFKIPTISKVCQDKQNSISAILHYSGMAGLTNLQKTVTVYSNQHDQTDVQKITYK